MTTDDDRYRSQARPDGDAFGTLLRAEWVKFRTVRGWVAGLIVAALAIMILGLGPSATGSCGMNGPASDCTQTLGPGRRTGDGQLLLRAPAARRKRQHHRPDDLADRPDPRFLRKRRRRRQAEDAQRTRVVGEGGDHRQGEHPARDRRTRR